jgi:SprT protein
MKNFHVLQRFIPGGASEEIEKLLNAHPVNIRITKSRQSKLGDFRPQPHDKYHAITINYDLNPYAFLITLVHEIAHLTTWKDFQNKVDPHGMEWKFQFKFLMDPFFKLNVFPEEVAFALKSYMNNPAASSCSSPSLTKALKKHDKDAHHYTFLDELPTHAIFKLKNQQQFVFKKGEKARTRFKCLEIKSNREYWVTAHAEVIPINE